jgi:hypothetical protein
MAGLQVTVKEYAIITFGPNSFWMQGLRWCPMPMSPLIGQFGPKTTFGRKEKERVLCASVHENIPIAFYGGLVGSD